ncbi:class I SAM-dependent methyltransferase [Planctomycetota bacterium]|nr:class I SAM-dependent methyltransferase [Planctomycetota bacterium]
MSFLDHYKQTLATNYTWLFGGRVFNEANNSAFYAKHLPASGNEALIVDLGAGPGFHSLPLAKMGYRVLAVDLCEDLLDELDAAREDANVTAVHADICKYLPTLKENADVVLCMGDTLSHFESLKDVSELIRDAKTALKDEGTLILSYRDLSAQKDTAQTVIPVRSEANRIATCVLAYNGEKVEVSDIFYNRANADSEWGMATSTYEKLIIPIDWLIGELESNQFKISFQDNQRGMLTLIAKPR